MYQDIKRVSWISSSFGNSFGSREDTDEICYKPVEKRTKIKINKKPNCFNSFSSVSDGDFVESDLGSNRERVWTDKHAPTKLDNLVVHKKKITEVSDYLKSVFTSCNCNRILLITGPAGCGKTCTLNAVCRFLNINIVEWATPINNSVNVSYSYDFSTFNTIDTLKSNKHAEICKRSSVQMFNEFIFQAAKYSSLLLPESVDRKIILVKDLPNVFLECPKIFYETIKRYYGISHNTSPLVFIISDGNIIHDLFPDDLKSDLKINNVSFNPVTSANIVKALDRILSLETLKHKRPSKDELMDIANSSDGDLRSAILKLQFTVSSSCKSSFNFKVPKPLISRSERIKVIKSSSKLKQTKHNICEIDKDKTVDFFSSVGRVLYPKKEYLNSDNKVKGDYRFVHSPNKMADIYLSEPNKFTNILHENYLERFTDIKDVCHAANSLSLSDLFISSNWESKDMMTIYSLNTIVYSLMVSNTKPAPNTFRPMKKSNIWATENKKINNEILIRQIFSDIQCRKDILLDVLPYVNYLKVNIKLTKDEEEDILKITQYN